MMQARRTSMWSSGYELELDGEPPATFERSVWRNGGRFDIGGRPYEVRSNLWASSYMLVGGAVADLPGMPPVVAVFAVAVVLTTWDVAAAT